MAETVNQNIQDILDLGNRCASVTSAIIKDAQFAEGDSYAFMVLCFTNRQLDHWKSLRKLVPSRDCLLVARAMFEGLLLLQWAKTGNRAERWHSFAAIADWREVRLRDALGLKVSDEDRRQINLRAQKHGRTFYTKAARKAVGAGKPLPSDPYEKRWHASTTIRQILEQQQSLHTYELVYERFSDWVHWGIAGIGRILERDKEVIQYRPVRELDVEHALQVAFLSMMGCAHLANEKLNRGKEADLQTIGNKWINRFPPYAVQAQEAGRGQSDAIES
jgi:hypothetical protein